MRERIGKIGVEAARAVDYVGAGTIEGLLQDGEYFFLEMNTRVQVEHCVTEMIDRHRHRPRGHPRRGRRGALGRPGRRRPARARDRVPHQRRGRLEELRPGAGPDHDYREPAGPGVRVDSGVTAGSEISPMYDPMVAKLIVWDADREQATARMLRALDEYEIGGLKTLIPFHVALLQTEQWAQRRDLPRPARGQGLAQGARLPEGREAGRRRRRGRGDRRADLHRRGLRPQFDVKVIGPPFGGRRRGRQRRRAVGRAQAPARRERADGGGGGGADELVSPLQGNMWKVLVEQGQTVEEGQLVCIIEAMKMENEITAHKAGVVEELAVKEGDAVTSGATIAVIKSPT